MTNAKHAAGVAEQVARRTTHDGITVFLHADGAISTRMRIMPKAFRFPVEKMWRLIDDVCLWDFEEIPALTRLAREGRYPRKIGSGRMDPIIMQRVRENLMHDRRVGRDANGRLR